MAEPGPGAPLVVACLAPTDLYPESDQRSGAVVADTRRAELSASDAAALEHALRAADAWGGRVLAVAAGGAEVEPSLVEAATLGAAVLRVEAVAAGITRPSSLGRRPLQPWELAGEPSGIASALASAIRSYGDPQLVVCGVASALQGTGAVPALLAHHLGTGQALGLVRFAVGQEPGTITAERRLDRGFRETIEISGPAVVSIEAAGVRLRRAPLAAALAAGDLEVPVQRVDAATPWEVRLGAPRPYRPRTRPVPPPEGDTRQRLLALTGALSNRSPARVVGPLDPADAADELLDYLRRNGYSG